MLKHRHEIASGVTSSVAPELIGYRNLSMRDGDTTMGTEVVNYASGNVSSWNDIHSAAEDGRLVFVTDSAGHPRYRRTIIRNLVSWAPHWTICCVAADDDEDDGGRIGATASAEEIFGSAGAGVNLSKAHLELCLDLGLSLVVVITKLDLASKTGLRQTLAKVLSTLKAAGRPPVMLSTTSKEHQDFQSQSLADSEEDEIRRMLASVGGEKADMLVPIVLTSAVSGTGIGKLHALLRHLPIPPPVRPKGSPISADITPGLPGAPPVSLFHIDEIFEKSNTQIHSIQDVNSPSTSQLLILSGHMRYGVFSVGEELLVGPMALDTSNEYAELGMSHGSSFTGQFKDVPRAETSTTARAGLSAQDPNDLLLDTSFNGSSLPDFHHWQRVRVLSLRNLRLPVRKLLSGQVGTISITSLGSARFRDPSRKGASAANLKLRKGMILANFNRSPNVNVILATHRGFTATFDQHGPITLLPGTLVIAYIASIRASVKVLSIVASNNVEAVSSSVGANGVNDGGVGLSHGHPGSMRFEATFKFMQYREWIEIDTQVLVMPSGSSIAGTSERGEKATVGLEGYVGRVTQIMT